MITDQAVYSDSMKLLTSKMILFAHVSVKAALQNPLQRIAHWIVQAAKKKLIPTADQENPLATVNKNPNPMKIITLMSVNKGQY